MGLVTTFTIKCSTGQIRQGLSSEAQVSCLDSLKNALLQQEAQDCLLRAAEALSGSAESVLIADYGSSASANSALLLAPVVQCLAAKQVPDLMPFSAS